MKQNVFDMMKFSYQLLLALSLFVCGNGFTQDKVERQHRIKKAQFPSQSLKIVSENAKDLKRLRFYREVDTAKKTYTAKFKKARLFYEMDFNQDGKLKSMGFNVKQVDIPEESFKLITNYISKNFGKSKIRKMIQLYPTVKNNAESTIKNALQNLMLSNMFYEILLRTKKDGKPSEYEVIFDSEGNFESAKKSLPPNYDRILY